LDIIIPFYKRKLEFFSKVSNKLWVSAYKKRRDHVKSVLFPTLAMPSVYSLLCVLGSGDTEETK
jgi:hypothetical protein